MGREQVRRLPIVDNGKLLAMVSLWCESLSGHLSRPSGVRWPLLEQIDESRRGLGKVLDSLGWGPIETPSRVEKIDRILETMNRAPSAGDLQAYYAYSLIARRKAFGDSTAVRLHTESGAQLHRTLPSAYLPAEGHFIQVVSLAPSLLAVGQSVEAVLRPDQFSEELTAEYDAASQAGPEGSEELGCSSGLSPVSQQKTICIY